MVYPPLTLAANRLKHAAPQQFDELLRELDAILAGLHESLTSADQAAILNVQGRTQQTRELLRALKAPPPKQPQPPEAAGA